MGLIFILLGSKIDEMKIYHMNTRRCASPARWDIYFCNAHVYILLWNSFQIRLEHSYDEYHHDHTWKRKKKDSLYKKNPKSTWFFIKFHIFLIHTCHELCDQDFMKLQKYTVLYSKLKLLEPFGSFNESKKISNTSHKF